MGRTFFQRVFECTPQQQKHYASSRSHFLALSGCHWQAYKPLAQALLILYRCQKKEQVALLLRSRLPLHILCNLRN